MDRASNLLAAPFRNEKIGEWMRRQILSGELTPGTRLPSMQELAAQWNTSYYTIYSELTPLVREGLLERKRKSGTVVCGAAPRLSCIGIYYGLDIWANQATAFYQALHTALKKRLDERELSLRVLVDSRTRSRQSEPLPELIKAVQGREIQGLIVPTANSEEKKWLRKLPVPIALSGSSNILPSVHFDLIGSLTSALRQLKSRGVRKVGLIGSAPRYPSPAAAPATGEHPYTTYYRRFFELTAELGLETKEEWCRAPSQVPGVNQVEEFGYHSFLELWKLPKDNRPEGIYCRTDVLSRGVVLAVLQTQAQLSDALALILEKNDDFGFFCPFPVDWVVYRAEDKAEALLQALEDQIAGMAPTKTVVPTRLEPCSKG